MTIPADDPVPEATVAFTSSPVEALASSTSKDRTHRQQVRRPLQERGQPFTDQPVVLDQCDGDLRAHDTSPLTWSASGPFSSIILRSVGRRAISSSHTRRSP